MPTPKEVTDMARACDLKHKDNATAAIEEMRRRVRLLPNYVDYVEGLVDDAVQDLIYDVRYQRSRMIKNRAQNSPYAGPAKVVVGNSKEVTRALGDLYDLTCMGRSLGLIFGKELPDAAAYERRVAGGHLVNAVLCERLAPLTPQEKTVKQAVPLKKLHALYRAARLEVDSSAESEGAA